MEKLLIREENTFIRKDRTLTFGIHLNWWGERGNNKEEEEDIEKKKKKIKKIRTRAGRG